MMMPKSFGLFLFVGVILMASLADMFGASYCEGWRKMPCLCTTQKNGHVLIQCQQMSSFGEIIDGLRTDFGPDRPVTLEIDNSTLDDLHLRRFTEMNMTIVNLKLNNNYGLRHVHPYTFAGLTHVHSFSLADNPISYVPTAVIQEMPNIATLDLGRMKVSSVREDSLNGFGKVQSLLLPGNLIDEIDTNSIPINVTRLHLGHNRLRQLNGTLRHLNELIWLFVNDNQLISLDDELPINGSKMILLHASHNRIEKLPEEIRHLPSLQSLFIYNNRITTLDGVLSKFRYLARLQLERNRLKMLQEDDFAEAINLQHLCLSYNHLTSLNSSMRPLINLINLNVSHNRLGEFSFEEIKGLNNLTELDLSNNRIRHLIGFTMNSLEWGSNLSHLYLDHNEIHHLNGAVSGFRKLIRLNVSFNKITRISPDDFIGLEKLVMLDISHNHLTTLEETSKTYLPQLQELLVSNNYLTILDKDFHGLPVLCWADLSYNQIVSIGRELVSKTHCKFNDNLHSTSIWRDLLIDLKGNPILCDASYPDLQRDMESNHTKIMGAANCAPLIDQSHNNYNYVQETTQQPPEILHQHVEPPYLNPIYNLAYNPIDDISNQVKKSIEANDADSNSHQNQIQPAAAIVDTDETKTPTVKMQEPLFVPLKTKNESNRQEGAPKPAETKLPLPYQHQILAEGEIKDLNQQHVYTHIDPSVQEQQISQMATEIEQLRAKVEELATANQRLADNLNQQNLDGKFFEDTRPIVPLAQIPALSTIKPPNEEILYERTP